MMARRTSLLLLLTLCAVCLLGYASGKNIYRGVATDEWLFGCADLQALSRMSWYWNYNLAPKANVANCTGLRYIEFVPMVWGKSQAQQTDIASQIPPGSKHLMAFNEPNFASQSNLTPQEAATLWQGVIAQLDAAGLTSSLKFGTPSSSPGGSSPLNATEWLRQFLQACSGCRFDFITLHNYDCNGSYFNGASTMYWVDLFHSWFPSLPIWLTEFSCTQNSPSEAQEIQYMNDLLARLDNASYVERYSWFTVRPNNLGTQTPALLSYSSSALTNVGITYNSVGDLLPSGTTTSSNTNSNSGGSSNSPASRIHSSFFTWLRELL